MIDYFKELVARGLEQHAARDHTRTTIGQVTAVDATNSRLSARLAGDTTATTNIPFDPRLTYAVNDYVKVLIEGSRSYWVLGKTNAVV